MTEESYRHARIIMKKANMWRSKIIIAENGVAKWQEKARKHKADKRLIIYEAAMLNVKYFDAQLQMAKAEFSALQFI